MLASCVTTVCHRKWNKGTVAIDADPDQERHGAHGKLVKENGSEEPADVADVYELTKSLIRGQAAMLETMYTMNTRGKYFHDERLLEHVMTRKKFEEKNEEILKFARVNQSRRNMAKSRRSSVAVMASDENGAGFSSSNNSLSGDED